VDGEGQGVAGGEQGRRITPATEEPGWQSRGGENRDARRKKGGGMQLRTDLQNQRKAGTLL
jgi:hypothetical protein